MNIITVMFGRDEEKYLFRSLKSLIAQSLPIQKIIYVDDASLDDSVSVTKKFGATVIRLYKRHPSYVGRPELSKIINKAFNYIYSNNIQSDFILIAGTDMYYPPTYLKRLVQKMLDDKNLVIASGAVKSEYSYYDVPRGAGRLIRTSFWDKHVKFFPFRWIWESYPIYKARALGFKAICFSDIIQYPLRPTALYKGNYGYVMREIGYIPLYALGRCLLAIIRRPMFGLTMLYSYLTCDFQPHEDKIAKWVRYYQFRRIKHILKSLREIINMVKN